MEHATVNIEIVQAANLEFLGQENVRYVAVLYDCELKEITRTKPTMGTDDFLYAMWHSVHLGLPMERIKHGISVKVFQQTASMFGMFKKFRRTCLGSFGC